MPSIIPKSYFCPTCKKETTKKICDCGNKSKPQPPYSVRFRWIDESGVERNMRISAESKKGWQTQSAAQRGYEEWIAKHPSHKKAELKVFTFRDLYEEYKAHLRVNIKESSYRAFTQRMDGFVLPAFGEKDVTEIKPADIVKWQNGLSEKGLSLKYKKAIRSAFSHFYEYLKVYGIQNPLSLVNGFKTSIEQKKEMLYWTQDEFQQFIACVDDQRFKSVFSFLYLTGCRKGEALALKWGDINFDQRVANVHATLTKCSDKDREQHEGIVLSDLYRITTPKTENSYRKILLPKNLLSNLAELKEAQESEFVFGKKGTFLSFNTLEHAFKRYIKISGVKEIRVHDLRHSHASLLINQGENQLATIYVIANRLGDSVDMIFKTYGHLFPNTQKDLIDRLDFEL